MAGGTRRPPDDRADPGFGLGEALLGERWMAEQHPRYAAHTAGTRRFPPGIF